MGIKEVLQRFWEKRKKLKEYEDELRLRRTAEERMKTPQQRDLEEYYEKQRQERIKERLKEFRKKQQRDWWKSPYKQNLPVQRNGLSLYGGMYLE